MKFKFTKQFKESILYGTFDISKLDPDSWTITSYRKNGRKSETLKMKFKISKADKTFRYNNKNDSYELNWQASSMTFQNKKYDISKFVIKYMDYLNVSEWKLDEMDLGLQMYETITLNFDFPFIRLS